MADVFIQLLVEKLISTVRSELGLIHGVDKQLQNLASTLATINAVLLDADRRQHHDSAVSLWLRRLKHAAYAIDDILDDCSFEAFKKRAPQKIDKLQTSFLLPSFTTFDGIIFRRSLAKRAKQAVETLDRIAEERIKFHLHSSPLAYSPPPLPDRRTSSFATVGEVLGRDKDREVVADTLLRVFANTGGVSIYAVVGLGGLGKTTLVQSVYADERVAERFPVRLWVCVPECGGRGMAAAVMQAVSGETWEGRELEQLHRRLHEELQGKRYLLVLDDVWEEDETGWEKLRPALPVGDGGSAVVVTTRCEKTATAMATTVHRLGSLSDHHCWEIFRKRAFAGMTDGGGNFAAIGKEIVKKCGGVPLAAMALGSMMRFKEEESQWISVKESEIWKMESSCHRKTSAAAILPALRLSYDHLPPPHKRCFAFCAVFPRGARISKNSLVQLWISNSLISSSAEMYQEDAGDEVFNQLYCSCFFSDEIRGSYGEILSVKIHDLMYDLAMSVAGDEVWEMVAESPGGGISPCIKHVAVVSGEMERHATALTASAESVRTLLQQQRGQLVFSGKALCLICCNSPALSFLRVLDAGGMRSPAALPLCVGGLRHLRYLDLSHGAMEKLPDSISGLLHLQFLILRHCSDLKSLPKQIVRLLNLRHLDIHGCSSLTSLPRGIGKLKSLNMISVFLVGKKEGRRLTELQNLNLRGDILIKFLENVKDPADARSVALEMKKNLISVEFQWGNPVVNGDLALKVLDFLKPCPNIRRLRIEKYSGDDFPLWMKEFSLEMITDLDISSCENCSKIPELGHLRSLKTLKIERMKKIQWINENVDFPALETLSISAIPNLLRLCKHINPKKPPFPSLKKLSIADCPNLTLSPHPVLTDLKCYGCSETLLSSIPDLKTLTLENLVVAFNATVTKLPEMAFCNLRSLRIESFSKLKTITEEDLRPLKSLRILQIRHCGEMESLSEFPGTRYNVGGECPEMESIELVRCERLVELPWRIGRMKALERVEIKDNMRMVSLPEGLRGAPWVKEVTVCRCEMLGGLPEWMGEMRGLRTLKVLFCPKVRRLPGSLKGLEKLQYLYVWGCPELQKRCREDGGEDWHIISHVPYLHFYGDSC